MQISQTSKQALRNPWVLGWLASVFIVLIINTVFISTAIVTSPGLVEENYYEKGQDHERNVQTLLASRSRLGWQVTLEPSASIRQQQSTNLYLTLKDRQGAPLDVERVQLTAYRPSDARADIHQVMENIAPGRYLTAITFPLKGLWELQAQVSQGTDTIETNLRIQVESE